MLSNKEGLLRVFRSARDEMERSAAKGEEVAGIALDKNPDMTEHEYRRIWTNELESSEFTCNVVSFLETELKNEGVIQTILSDDWFCAWFCPTGVTKALPFFSYEEGQPFLPNDEDVIPIWESQERRILALGFLIAIVDDLSEEEVDAFMYNLAAYGRITGSSLRA